jgi:hypothetical protein
LSCLPALAACGPSGPGAGGAGSTGASPADGSYYCVFFIDGSGLQTVPGFSIAGGSYRHEDGTGGTATFDAGSSTVEFSGGALNGQAALFEPGPPTRLRLYNETRSRTVIDCDRR